MSKEDIKLLEKRIAEVEIDKRRALFDYNYQLAAHLKGVLGTLKAQLKHLQENSENPETI